jgi:hypothetical protein
MIRFNRRSWLLSIRISQLADIDPLLQPAALALQAAVLAEELAATESWWSTADRGAAGRRASRRSARLGRPVPRRGAIRHPRVAS